MNNGWRCQKTLDVLPSGPVSFCVNQLFRDRAVVNGEPRAVLSQLNIRRRTALPVPIRNPAPRAKRLQLLFLKLAESNLKAQTRALVGANSAQKLVFSQTNPGKY